MDRDKIFAAYEYAMRWWADAQPGTASFAAAEVAVERARKDMGELMSVREKQKSRKVKFVLTVKDENPLLYTHFEAELHLSAQRRVTLWDARNALIFPSGQYAKLPSAMAWIPDRFEWPETTVPKGETARWYFCDNSPRNQPYLRSNYTDEVVRCHIYYRIVAFDPWDGKF